VGLYINESLHTVKGVPNAGVSFSVVTLLLLRSFAPIFTSAQTVDNITEGPFISTLTYKVLTGEGQQIQALQDGTIDLLGNALCYDVAQILAQTQNIEVCNTSSNGYGCFILNTNKYPLNITQFRQAIAFALDKQYISEHIWNGFATPQDSVVPAVNPLSIEGSADLNYYSSEVQRANQMLDDSGFAINQTTGFRQAPDGSDFTLKIESALSSSSADQICLILNSTLAELAIRARYYPPTFDYPTRLYYHGDYDIFFMQQTFSSFDLSWLGYEFWSGYASRPLWNLANFCNQTYDSYRETLIHSVDYGDVAHAARMMQEILLYQCPYIVVYEKMVLTAYRTDSFTGYVNQVLSGSSGWWTNYKVHLVNGENGPNGGSFRRSTAGDVDTLNLLVTSSEYSRSVLGELYDSLFVLGPNGENIPWLANSYTAETHQDSSSVPEGHVRFVFQIRSGFNWSDGYPLTAVDIAYTLTMVHDSDSLNYHDSVSNMTAAYARSPSSLVVEFDAESYWYLYSMPYVPIFPKHIMMNMTQDDILNWNPDVGDARQVTSGPFLIDEYEPANHITLIGNEHYPFRHMPTTSENTTASDLSFFDYLDGFARIL
jgi:ABC-type transport system substrate-binding protein